VIDAILCKGDNDPTKSTSPGGNKPEPGPLPIGDSCLAAPGDLASEGLSGGPGVSVLGLFSALSSLPFC